MHEPIGFMAKAPVSEWNKRIGVDYPGVFKAVLKAALAVATANAPGAVAAAIDGFFGFKVEDAKRPPEELAWLLTRRALARAMAELTVEAARRHGMLLQDKDELVAALDGALDGSEIWVDPAFFDRPAEHPIVDGVRPQFHEWLVRLGLNDAEATSVNHRLGAYFTFALRREWAEHSEYAPLEAEFQKYENRFAKADARERAWIRNAEYLQRLIREPVFDEAFGLEQIYVPLRAWYQDTPAKSSRRGRSPDESAGEAARQVVVDLGKHLDVWLIKGDKKDPLRVICGGPGSGKTSVAKIWAAELARDGKRVLYVPLHRLDIRGDVPDVQAMLWEYLSDLSILPHDPLDSKNGESQLLILFDGLDELAMQGRAGQEVARSFVDAVRSKIERLNEREGCLIQVVFGGRDIAVEAARLSEQEVLHILPYHNTEAESFEDEAFEDAEALLETSADAASNDTPQELPGSESYACDQWWRQFGKAVGESYSGLPKELQTQDLAEITAQPLLNYLLALSFRRGAVDFRAAPNLNLIYQDLLDAVYERRWGPGRHPIGQQRACEEFQALLEELGLAAWQGAGRTVSEAQVEQACRQAGLGEQLGRFKEGAKMGAVSLLAAFYFRQAGKIEGERTFEFTHKSFGEYLTARRIVRWMEDIHEERARNRENRLRGWPIEDSLLRWVEATGPSGLDRDLLVFMPRDVELRSRDLVSAWQTTLVELFSDQLRHGLPMQKSGLLTFQEMKRQARNAEEALLAMLWACSETTTETSVVEWPTETSFGSMMMRLLDAPRKSDIAVAAVCCSHLDLRQQVCFGLDLSDSNLSNSNLRSANLAQTCLWGTNLYSTDLSGANLFNANLAHAKLEGANLIGVTGLDETLGLKEVRSWRRAKIERRWVVKLGLDVEGADLDVIEGIEDERATKTPRRRRRTRISRSAGESSVFFAL